jgi:predicted ATPase
LLTFCAWGDGLEAAAAIKRGAFEPATSVLRGAIDGMQRAHIVVFGAILVATLAEGLQGCGDHSGALQMIDVAIEQSDRTQSGWFQAEQLRIKGELLHAEGGTAAERSAAACFERSLELSRRQGALSWELRTTMSVARLLLRKSQAHRAQELVRAVVRRFSEGFDTMDLVSATALIDSLPIETIAA